MVITGLLLALAVGLALWVSGVLGPKWSVFKRSPDSGITRDKTFEEVVADFKRATSFLNTRVDPHVAAFRRGLAQRHKGQYDEAIADFDEDIRLAPKFDRAYQGRARLWATCPDAKYRDGKRAIESAIRACELTAWKKADYLDTLAAAYAEAGDFAKAVEWQQKAEDLYTDAEGRAVGQERLKLYWNRKPYREP
jgi:tetratricopeptide (TPR) repeat protein